MAWGSEIPQTITEANAGDGAGSDWVIANPGEKIHFDIERVDVGPTEPWRAAIEVTTDPTLAPPYRPSNPPILNRRLRVTNLTPNIVVSGYYAYRVWVENDDATPFDKVSATVRYRKDGLDL